MRIATFSESQVHQALIGAACQRLQDSQWQMPEIRGGPSIAMVAAPQ